MYFTEHQKSTLGQETSQIFDNFFTLRSSPFNLGSLKSGVEINAS